MHNITIRNAVSASDRAAVYRLRYERYVEDQGLFQQHADHDNRWLRDNDDDDATLIMAEVDGDLVGTLRALWGGAITFSSETRSTYELQRFRGVIDERDIVIGDRLVVREHYRGTTLTQALVARGLEDVVRCNAELILSNCEPTLVPHYLQFGFRPYGGVSNHPTNGVLVGIGMIAGDLDYLRAIDSPVLPLMRRRTRPARATTPLRARFAEQTTFITERAAPTRFWDAVYRWYDRHAPDQVGITDTFTCEEVNALLAGGQLLTVRENDAIIRTGQAARTLYVLFGGSLEVLDGETSTATVQTPGSLVGTASFADEVHKYDVLAGRSGAQVLVLSEKTLRRLLSDRSELARKLMRSIERADHAPPVFARHSLSGSRCHR